MDSIHDSPNQLGKESRLSIVHDKQTGLRPGKAREPL